MSSIRLSLGLTHYELSGPDGAPLVVMLHGSTIPSWVFDRQVPALHEAGFRVLRYDMYGKGQSQSPRVEYDRLMYCTQLLELLEALGISEHFHLVGFSFGGGLAAQFVAQYPDKVLSLTMLAPVLDAASTNSLIKLVRIPLLGSALLKAFLLNKVVSRAEKLWAEVGKADSGAHYRKMFEAQLKVEGFIPALKSFLLGNALADYSEVYRVIGKSRLPKLLIWGDADQDIPGAHIKQIISLVPDLNYQELKGVGHGLVFQASEEVNAQLTKFLKSVV